MLLLSVLVAFALEYYFRWGSEYRVFKWFHLLEAKINELLGEQHFYHGWLGLLLIILTPVLFLGILLNALGGALYLLLVLPISIATLFYCLGPKSLEKTMDAYFSAVDRGDKEAGFLILEQDENTPDIPQSEELERNATRFILIESNKRYFGVIVWFIFFGPCGALFYRLVHEYQELCIEKELDEHLLLTNKLMHWVDWVPSRMTSIFNLLTGDFVAGFYRFKDYWSDPYASNEQLISESGIAALGLKMGYIDDQRDENREAMDMVIRTGIIYLVAVAVLSPLSFW